MGGQIKLILFGRMKYLSYLCTRNSEINLLSIICRIACWFER